MSIGISVPKCIDKCHSCNLSSGGCIAGGGDDDYSRIYGPLPERKKPKKLTAEEYGKSFTFNWSDCL